MSHTPSTIQGEPGGKAPIAWDDAAALHRAGDEGLLSELTAVRHGALADLVRYIALLPEAERADYVVERTGDHRLSVDEVLELYARADFPHAN